MYNPEDHGARCGDCYLRRRREGLPVGPELHTNALALLIEEAPREEDVKAGRPMVGPAGQELNRGLEALGLSRDQFSITTAICCRPPQNDLDKIRREIQAENKKRKKNEESPLLSPEACCRPRLLQEIRSHAVDGSVNILTFGKIAAQSVLQSTISILDRRGGPINGVLSSAGNFSAFMDAEQAETEWIRQATIAVEKKTDEIPLQIKLLPTIRPSFVIRMRRWTKAFRADLGRSTRWFSNELDWVDPKITLNPTVEEFKHFLSRFSLTHPASVDIETRKEDPNDQNFDCLTDVLRCISISDQDEAMVVHTESIDRVRKFYTDEDLLEIVEVLIAFLSDTNVLKVGHNFIYYDAAVLKKQLGVSVQPIRDSIVLSKSISSELPHRLAYVASIFSDAPSWKAQKTALTAQTDEELGKYCLFYNTQVRLANGKGMPIDRIVRQRAAVEVLSLGPNGMEAKRVIGWHRQSVNGQRWIRLLSKADARPHGLIVTPEHIVYTTRGQVRADEIQLGDRILIDEPLWTAAQKSAILGTLLGDSTIEVQAKYRHNRHATPSGMINGGHVSSSGMAQRKLKLLPTILREGKLTAAGTYQIGDRSGERGEFQPFHSLSLYQIAEILPQFYGNDGERILNISVLEALGPIGLAWWFMDDGCRNLVNRASPDGVFRQDCVKLSTHRYPRADIEVAAAWFTKRYGTTWCTTVGELYLGRVAARAFCVEIAPHVFPEMRRKLVRGFDSADFDPTPFDEISVTPASAEIIEAAEWFPPIDSSSQRFWAKTRYCITVEDNHNFFTNYGLVKNCGVDTVVVARILPKLETALALKKQTTVAANDHRVMEVCVGLHEQGMYVNQDVRRWHDVRLLKEAQKWQARCRIHSEDDKFNPGSANAVRELLFEKWGLMPPVATLGKNKVFTKAGLPSTGDEVILALRTSGQLTEPQLRLVESLRKYRRATKERGTYVMKPRSKYEEYYLDDFSRDEDEFDADNSEDLAEMFFQDKYEKASKKQGMVLRDGRIHPDYNLGANTGRLSSSGWNAANVTKKLRDMIEPQPGNVFVYADMDQIQLRIIACASQSEGYIKTFSEGGDAHAVTAEAIFGAAWLALEKDTADWDALRDFSKCFTYVVAFGAELPTVLATLRATEDRKGNLPYAKMTLDECRARYEAFLSKIPFLSWWESIIERYRKQGYLADPVWGRKRDFADGEDRNAILCYETQSTESSIVHDAEFELIANIPFGKWGHGTGLIHECYDSLMVECPESKAEWVKKEVEHAMNRTVAGFETPFTAKAKIVRSWYEPICESKSCKKQKLKFTPKSGYSCSICGVAP